MNDWNAASTTERILSVYQPPAIPPWEEWEKIADSADSDNISPFAREKLQEFVKLLKEGNNWERALSRGQFDKDTGVFWVRKEALETKLPYSFAFYNGHVFATLKGGGSKRVGEGGYKKPAFALDMGDMSPHVIATIKLRAMKGFSQIEERQRVADEIEILKKVRHIPECIRLVGSFVALSKDLSCEKAFMIFDRCIGGDLFEALNNSETPISIRLKTQLPDLLNVALCIAQGLKAIHAIKIIHFDLASQNIFLSFNEMGRLSAKLGDFGIAKNWADLKNQLIKRTANKFNNGNPFICPYYQRLSRLPYPPYDDQVDPVCNGSVDMWGFGQVLYALTWGYYLHADRDGEKIVFSDIGQELVDQSLKEWEEPRQKNLFACLKESPETDQLLIRFVKNTLQIDPVSRYTAAYIAQRLSEHIKGLFDK